MVTTLSEFKYCIISSSVYSLVWLPLNSTTPNMNHYKYIRIFGDSEHCWHKSQCVRSGLISGTVLFCMTLYCTVLYCTDLCFMEEIWSAISVLCFTLLYCTVVYYTVLCCTDLCFMEEIWSAICYCTNVLFCTVLYWPLLHGGDLVRYLVLLLGEHVSWLGEGAHVPRHVLQLLLQTWHSDRSITTIIYSNKG